MKKNIVAICIHDGCKRDAHAKNFCNTHYKPAMAAGLIGPRTPCKRASCTKFKVHRDGLCHVHHRQATPTFLKKEKRRREKASRREKRKTWDAKYAKSKKRAATIRRYAVNRAAQIKLASPRWLTADHHWLIRQFTEALVPGYAVDHVIPLRGKNVSGLNVPWNLQIMPSKDNLLKSNKFNFEEYKEIWLKKIS